MLVSILKYQAIAIDVITLFHRNILFQFPAGLTMTQLINIEININLKPNELITRIIDERLDGQTHFGSPSERKRFSFQ